ncbi:ATPase inhibitor, mitochondrial precursor, putative [Paecilomyces variotii No. 5]|uniref:ATPase inhibitor, mitochondrial n=1 Tax=Byssochlamys spectabilis (strain No. 5 / NBRC 109023) TaxID=1356009 RepID=V5FNB2_BYSSN|nr:ATPase inhibitor, mitochondrial precursor, putative [Paecilomyces variotii No. 5]
MFRQAIARPLLRTSTPVVNRSFSVAAVRMAEGDLGAPRKGGAQQEYVLLFSGCSLFILQSIDALDAMPDTFSRREAAQENLYVREKEMEKLRALKSKLKEQRAHLDELDKHIDELTRSQGGEQN